MGFYTIGQESYVIPSGYSIDPVYETAAKNDYFDSISSYKLDLTSQAQMSSEARAFEEAGAQVQIQQNSQSSKSESGSYSFKYNRAYTKSETKTQQWTTKKKSCFLFWCD